MLIASTLTSENQKKAEYTKCTSYLHCTELRPEHRVFQQNLDVKYIHTVSKQTHILVFRLIQKLMSIKHVLEVVLCMSTFRHRHIFFTPVPGPLPPPRTHLQLPTPEEALY